MSKNNANKRTRNGGATPGNRRTQQANPRGPPPTVQRIKTQLEASNSELHEAMYLHGFIDPNSACRGPGTCTNPTAIAVHSVVQEILVGTPTAIGTAISDSVAIADALPYRMNESGDFMLCMGPTHAMDVQGADGVYGATLRSGFFTDPNVSTGSSLIGSAAPTIPAGETPFKLMGEYDIDMPGARLNTVSTETIGGLPRQVSRAYCTPNVSYRVVGLKAEIESTTSVLDNQGSIFGGDMGAFRMDRASLRGEYEEDEAFAYATYRPAIAFDALRGDTNRNARLKLLGPVKLGAKYSACHIPTGDVDLTYNGAMDCVSFGEYNRAWRSPQFWKQAGNPYATFVVRGLHTSKVYSFVVTTTVAIEYQINKRNKASILYANARFAPRYVPDWSVLACVIPGYEGFAAHAAYMPTRAGQLSHHVHAGVLTKPHNVKPPSGVATAETTRPFLENALEGLGITTAIRAAWQGAKSAIPRFAPAVGRRVAQALVAYAPRVPALLL